MTLNIIMNIFSPFMMIPPLLAVILMSLIISVITTLVYKFTTNQNLMKQIKEEMKELQKSAKELRNEPSRAMEVQKKAMEANMKYMSHSLKPTLITFIPVILIFSWMNANFAFEPVRPGQDFSVSLMFEKNTEGNASISAPKDIKVDGSRKKSISDGKVSWLINGKEGEHTLEFTYNNEKYTKDILITSGRKYLPQSEKIKNSRLKEIRIDYRKLTLIPLGYKDWMGWLGTYIIASLAFTSLLRKWLKIF